MMASAGTEVWEFFAHVFVECCWLAGWMAGSFGPRLSSSARRSTSRVDVGKQAGWAGRASSFEAAW